MKMSTSKTTTHQSSPSRRSFRLLFAYGTIVAVVIVASALALTGTRRHDDDTLLLLQSQSKVHINDHAFIDSSSSSSSSQHHRSLTTFTGDIIERHAIVAFLDENSSDPEYLSRFCITLQSLRQYDVMKDRSSILIFYDQKFSEKNRKYIVEECTENPVFFHGVDLHLPAGFDAGEELKKNNGRVARQGSRQDFELWKFVKMIRFWTTLIWEHPATQKFDTIMRIDPDSCITLPTPPTDIEDHYLPGIRARYVYRTREISHGATSWIHGLYDFATSYMTERNLKPRNPALWDTIKYDWEQKRTFPYVHKKFAVSRVSFFLEEEVREWHKALTESEPFGVLRQRWSEHHTMLLTLAMFAEPEWVLMKELVGYGHGKKCVGLEVTDEWRGKTPQDLPPLPLPLPKPMVQRPPPGVEEEDSRPIFGNFLRAPEVSAPFDPEEVVNHDGHAVVSLVEDDDELLSRYCMALYSLEANGIVKPNSAAIHIFHEDDFPQDKKKRLTRCTSHPIAFHLADFSFPANFDAELEYEQSAQVARQGTMRHNRKTWGYAHMIRFWTTQVWKHPSIQGLRTIMRLDTDSCFIEPSNENDVEDHYLPGMRGRYIYRVNDVGTGIASWIKNLYDFAVSYMETEKITPKNQFLWNAITSTWKDEGTLPVFLKNFEVSRVSFYRRPDVMKWHEALTEREPFGVYRYRWSDSNTRVLTMAMFADPAQVLVKKHAGFKHGLNGCKPYFDGQEPKWT